MPKLTKTMMISAIFAAAATPALAQDVEKIVEPVPTAEADFMTSDLDQDGALDRDEFVTFAVMRKESGDAVFTEIVRAGDYDAKFIAHDHDANGSISTEELGHGEKKSEEFEPMIKPEAETPEME